jgi:ribosome-associated protein
MRREDDATLDAIREAMDANSDGARREVAAIHRVEDWRARLLADGDSALSELLGTHPEADRQRLRQLIRNAKDERLKNKPPHAYRELFRELRELVLGADSELGTRDSGLEAADLDALETDPDERD